MAGAAVVVVPPARLQTIEAAEAFFRDMSSLILVDNFEEGRHVDSPLFCNLQPVNKNKVENFLKNDVQEVSQLFDAPGWFQNEYAVVAKVKQNNQVYLVVYVEKHLSALSWLGIGVTAVAIGTTTVYLQPDRLKIVFDELQDPEKVRELLNWLIGIVSGLGVVAAAARVMHFGQHGFANPALLRGVIVEIAILKKLKLAYAHLNLKIDHLRSLVV